MIRRKTQYFPYTFIMKSTDGYGSNSLRYCLKKDILRRMPCFNFYVALTPLSIFLFYSLINGNNIRLW